MSSSKTLEESSSSISQSINNLKKSSTSSKSFELLTPTSSDSQGKLFSCSSSSSAKKSVSTASMPDSQETDLENKPRELHQWGFLEAIALEFNNFSLLYPEKRYTFGRDPGCSYSFDIPSVRKTKYFVKYAKKHFSINLEETIHKSKVWLKAYETKNSVFVNKSIVPPNKKVELCKDDIISLCTVENKLFRFDNTCKNFLKPALCSHPITITKFFKLNKVCIGTGAYGQVFEGQDLNTKKKVAIKLIQRLRGLGDQVIKDDVEKEGEILKKLKNDFIIEVLKTAYTKDFVYIVMEYASGGTLAERCLYNYKEKILKESTVKVYFYQLLKGVEYLHSMSITHRDIKPTNILMMSKKELCRLKITDFGCSKIFEKSHSMHSLVGTKIYSAPEIFECNGSSSKKGYSHLVDMWSMGTLLYVCLTGKLPYSKSRKDTNKTFDEQISSGEYIKTGFHIEQNNPYALDILFQLMEKDVSKRLNVKKALCHKWIDYDNTKLKVDKILSIMSSPSEDELFCIPRTNPDLIRKRSYSDVSTFIMSSKKQSTHIIPSISLPIKVVETNKVSVIVYTFT